MFSIYTEAGTQVNCYIGMDNGARLNQDNGEGQC